MKKTKPLTDSNSPNVSTPSLKSLQPLLLGKKKSTYEEDMQTCPDSNTLEEYESVPIESYGMNMLKSMGWKEGQHVGLSPKYGLLKPVEYIPRPSLLGLGADPSNSSQPPSLKRKSPDYILPRSADGKVRHTKAIDEKLKIKETLQVGSHVKIVYGVHEGLYGFVNELRESEVKITLKNMEKIRVPINYIKLASELAFKKPYTLPVPSVEKSITIPNGYESSWLKQGLRVRIISKILEDGQYYNKKASVLDVLPGNLGVLRVENDKRTVLDQVPQMYLETMIPSVGGKVMILKGTSEVDAGALARVLIKDKKKQECACGLEEDESLVYVFSFNDICEVETNTY